jgi:hypothetical protein
VQTVRAETKEIMEWGVTVGQRQKEVRVDEQLRRNHERKDVE